MPNHLKFCGCRACRDGLHGSALGHALARRAVRRLRKAAKEALREDVGPLFRVEWFESVWDEGYRIIPRTLDGWERIPQAVSVPYIG